MTTPLTEPKYIGDVVIDEPAGSVATRDQVNFKNDTGGDRAFVIGQTLVTSGAFRVPAPSSSADSILLVNINEGDDGYTSNGTQQAPALTHGPCYVDQDQLVYLDSVDGTEAAAQRAALLLLDIKCKREPLQQGDAEDVLT